MHADHRIKRIERKYRSLRGLMDERFVRCWAGVEAAALGRGGISIVATALGMSRTTIYNGLRDLPARPGAVRRPGGGRRRRATNDPERLARLETLIEPRAHHAAKSPLRWSVRSTQDLAEELTRRGCPACARHVAGLLNEGGYRLEGRRKPRTDGADQACNAQLKRLNIAVRRFLKRKQPAILLDLKTRRIAGDSRVSTRNRLGQRDVNNPRITFYKETSLPKDLRADLLNARTWSSMVLDDDTARFAADSVRNWWVRIGRSQFNRAKELLIAIDGGSESQRSQDWKKPLEKLRDELGVKVCVRHLPAATTRWTRLDGRQFSVVTRSHRGRTVARHQAVVSLIASP
jgi:hypothetical protein